MKARWHPRRWLEPFILSFLILVPMLLVMLGILSGLPLPAAQCPASHAGAQPLSMAARAAARTGPAGSRQAGTSPEPSAVRGTLGLSLDPHNPIHRFVLLPALAGLVVLGGWRAVWLIRRRRGADERPGDRKAWIRDGSLGLVAWLALSTFLILDLVGSVSLYPAFVTVYALGWVPAGWFLLHPQPSRVRILALVLLLGLFFSIRAVNWNSRKPFLKDLDRVRVGMTESQADQIMARYRKRISPQAVVDERGEVRSGIVSCRHTAEDWGNSDIGILTFENGRVVATEFLPD